MRILASEAIALGWKKALRRMFGAPPAKGAAAAIARIPPAAPVSEPLTITRDDRGRFVVIGRRVYGKYRSRQRALDRFAQVHRSRRPPRPAELAA